MSRPEFCGLHPAGDTFGPGMACVSLERGWGGDGFCLFVYFSSFS